MRRSTSPALFLLSLLAALLLGQAHAQYGGWTNPYTGNTWNNPGSSLLDTMIQGSRFMQDPAAGAAGNGGDGSGSGAAGEAGAELPRVSATSFRPAPQRLEVAAFAQSLTNDAAEQATFIQALEEGMALFEDAARDAGRPNNAAMAITYMIAANYAVYTGGLEVSDEAFETLWGAVHQMLAESLEFRRSSDRSRQSLYETAVMMATLPLMGYLQAVEAGDAGSAAMYQEFAGRVLSSSLGVAPDKVLFTATGVSLGD